MHRVRTSADAAVTVVIPTFNSEQTVARALLSLEAQNYSIALAVVVDDASTDSTVDAIRSLAVRFPLVVVQLPTNGGSGAARQAGLEQVASEYVGFLDADDEWHPHHLSRALKVLRMQPKVGATCAGAIVCTQVPDAWETLPPQQNRCLSLLDLVIGESVVQSSVVARTAVVRAAGGYRTEKRFAEDYDLWLRMGTLLDFYHIGERHIRRYAGETQVSRKVQQMVEGKWDALAHFSVLRLAQCSPTEQVELLSMVDRVLDADMRHARASWSRSLHQIILRYAERINPDSARLRFWSNWLRYGWPFLRTARFVVKDVPLLLQAAVEPMSRNRQPSLIR